MYQQMTGAQVVEVAHMEIAEPTIEQAIGAQRLMSKV
jgi:sirohydrochlorin ferrochelatase